MPQVSFNLAAIMRAAHRFWRSRRVATFSDALRRAWNAAKYEAWSVSTGRTRSSRGFAATLEVCEYIRSGQ